VRPAIARLALVLAALVTVAAVVVVVRMDRTPPPTTTTAPVRPETPVLLYSIAPPEGQPFRPRGATIVEGKAYVADSEGGRVAVLDLAAGAEASLGFIPLAPERPGDPLPARPQPVGVAALPDGSLAVADAGNGRVWRVGRDGSFFGDLVSDQERQRSGLVTPVGVASTDSQLFVTDIGDHTIKVYTHSGRFVRRLGGEGFRPGQLSYPNAVAVASGFIYVADSNNGRVQVLSADGTPLMVLEQGLEGEALRLPRGIAVDGLGRLHVADTFAHVALYYSEEQLQGSYGVRQPGEPGLELPEGIAVSDDRIVVSDSGNRRLVVYSY
jgi:DNA-binding beta-propeller fold protein YncE